MKTGRKKNLRYRHPLAGTLSAAVAAVLLTLLFGLSGPPVAAQQEIFTNSSQEAASPTPSPTATPEPSPTPIPVSDVVTEAEETSKTLQEIKESLTDNTAVAKISRELPELVRNIDSREKETTRTIAARPSLETLGSIEKEWKALAASIPDWKSDLKSRGAEIDKQIEELEKIRGIWQETLNKTKDAEIPSEVWEKIGQTIAAIKNTQKAAEDKRAELLTAQARISEQEKRIDKVLEAVSQAREEALSQLFVKDSPAIWDLTETGTDLRRNMGNSLSEQLGSLNEYINRRSGTIFVHLLVFLLLVVSLHRVRTRVRPLAEDEPELENAMTVFRKPVVSALILTVVVGIWLYPQAPNIFRTLLGAAALIPGIILLRNLIDRPVFPILNALVIFFFVDRLREVTEPLAVVSRILFLLEMLGGIIFLGWLLGSKRLTDKVQVQDYRTASIIRQIVPFAIFVFVAAFLANVFGYVSLSRIIGNGLLGSLYAALIIYSAIQIIKSLLIFAFRVPPLSSLGMVKNHRRLIQHRIFHVLLWGGVIAWIVFTLGFLSIREPVFAFIQNVFTAKLTIGSLSISLLDVLIFLLTIWIAFLISRLVRFVLDEDVYPRVDLAGGVPYAISTVLHYVLLMLGFFAAIAALGIDLTKFTILAGAFGVGLGFGLQNVVNNFVSGLILLFERPVKVGDMIQMGDRQGDLKQIGLRASIMRTLEGAEIIVPNGNLISEEVTNWTRSDPRRRLDISVGVKYGTDPERVIELLNEVGRQHPEVVKDPLPRTLFLGFGDSSLDFQLRAWTMSHDQWQVVKSELTVGIYKALNKADIEIPFPQRDLHFKSIDQKAVKNLSALRPGNDDG